MKNKKVKPNKKFISKKPVFTMIAIAASVQLLSNTVYAATMNTVKVTIDGEVQTIKTHADTVRELFKELKIVVNGRDYVNYPLDKNLSNGMSVIWRPAVKLALSVDDVTTERWTNDENVESFLKSENIILNEYDKIEPALSTQISKDMNISIDNGFPVNFDNGGTVTNIYTTTRSVVDFLEENSITLGEFDRIEPALTDRLTENTTIKITRVEKSTITEDKEIPFATIQMEDANLAAGTKQVTTVGENGVNRQEIEIVKENGEVVARNLVSETVVQPSINQVIKIGKKIPVAPTSNTGDMISYAKQFLGVPYLWGGETPSGFDCSGFVGYVFRNSLGISLPRTSASLYDIGTSVSNPQPGDLIFFNIGGRISHVGIYVGDDSFISATLSDGIKIDSLHNSYWGPKYAGARRL